MDKTGLFLSKFFRTVAYLITNFRDTPRVLVPNSEIPDDFTIAVLFSKTQYNNLVS